MQSQTFACPACGAALVAQGAQTQVTCGYCKSTVIVPESVRPKPQQQPVVVINNVTTTYNNYGMPDYGPVVPAPVRMQQTSGPSPFGCLAILTAGALLVVAMIIIVPFLAPRLYQQLTLPARQFLGGLDNSPHIYSFTVDPPIGRPGQPVMLDWTTNADHVQLDVSADGRTTTYQYLAGSGSLSVQPPNSVDNALFRLTAFRNGRQDTVVLRQVIGKR